MSGATREARHQGKMGQGGGRMVNMQRLMESEAVSWAGGEELLVETVSSFVDMHSLGRSPTHLEPPRHRSHRKKK